MDLLLRPPQNEGIYMQNLDEDQLARAFRLHPGILHNYDASPLDQDDDDDDDDDDDQRGSGDGQLNTRHINGIGGNSVHEDKQHRSGSGVDKKHKKKKKKRKHERENETEEERRKRKKRKRERALAAAAALGSGSGSINTVSSNGGSTITHS
ncbi:hypothetical protein BDF19DRAFT_222905 [Syncephalis fuscata]|nr:hypothetical protein BDF19DRAFT_222905 [Syncephalis fuscata]